LAGFLPNLTDLFVTNNAPLRRQIIAARASPANNQPAQLIELLIESMSLKRLMGLAADLG
jgi:hypothetical protein